jgi:ribulose-phosphate 3-epimerase
MEKQIIASIIASSQDELNQRINKVKDVVSIIQLDVMDGKFAPTQSINFDFKLPHLNCEVEADLMVQDPVSWIEKNHENVNTIIVHMESVKDILPVINLIKSKGKKVAIALDPITTVAQVMPFLDYLDQIMVFTADRIGYYGSAFSLNAVEKIKNIKYLKPSLLLEVDGGVNLKTIKILSDAGVDLFVSGSYLQNSENAQKAVDELMRLIK